MDDVVFHYLRVLDTLGLNTCVLAGSSLGAWIAAEIAEIGRASCRDRV